MNSTDSKICHPEKIAGGSNSSKTGFMSILTTSLMIILPKCPFCIAAYSGALLLFFDVDNMALVPIFTHLKPFLGFSILVLIVLNFKKEKPPLAIALSIIALLLIISSTYMNYTVMPSIYIYLIFLFAACYNGNFKSFYNFLLKKIKVSKA